MNLLRETIRRILLETDTWGSAKEAIESLKGVFEFKQSWVTGSWNDKIENSEFVWYPDPNDPSCIVRIRVNPSWNSLFLDEIETSPQCEGRGFAKQAIEKLKAVASAHGVSILLKPKAFHVDKGENRMNTEELKSFYRRQGFSDANGWGMEWKP